MRIAVLGASAGIGLQCVRLALQKGHEVVTLSRRVVPIPDQTTLIRVQGSATDGIAVRTAVEGADAVLVTIGTKSPLPTTMFSDSSRVLLQVLKETGSSPILLILTGFGTGDSWSYNSFPMRILFSLVLKQVYADKGVQEQLIAAGYSRWEIVRPGRLTNGNMTGRYRVLDTLVAGMKMAAIARADVAQFLVTQAEQPTYLGKYPALSY